MKVTYEELTENIKSKGLKATQQRLEILKFVAESHIHPDAMEVFEKLKPSMPSISLDTVYRTLWLLAKHGLISTVGFPCERAKFDGNLKPHHHFICTICGTIYDLYDENLDKIPVPESINNIGEVTTTQIEIKGLCNKCRNTITN
ncbi:MAG: transcriptional repressor [Acidobacteria bacterium]|nr:transcriptional repressor [Acidobacteriota bacterium]